MRSTSASTHAARLRAILAHRRFPLALAALAVILALPAVGTGLVVDDYGIRAAALGLLGDTPGPGTRFDIFSFFTGAPGERLRTIDSGWMPWWTSAALRLRFFRPLASFTHWLDFQLWPGSPAAMHLVSIAFSAALVLAAAAFYRRTLGPTWVAGLAAFFYAVDPGHAVSASWIAGRNTLLAALFGVLALVAHDRARRDRLRLGVPLAAALFALSLLSSEGGVATGAYLLAHAIYLDPEPSLARRLRALAPHAIVGVAWIAAYRLLGYGAQSSPMYLDPGRDPLAYLRALLLNAPILLHSQWGLAPASIVAALSVKATIALSVFGALACAIFARIVWPVLRADPIARFFAAGMLLSLLPIAATLPNDRLLFFVGLGALGLIARFVAAALAGPAREPLAQRVLAGFFVVVHALLAAPSAVINTQVLASFAQFSRDPLDQVLLDPAVAAQTVIFVNPPIHFFTSHLGLMRRGTAKPIPLRWRCLASGIYPVTLTRIDARTVDVRTDAGLLQPPGTWDDGSGGGAPPFNWSYPGQHLSQFVRPLDERMRPGDRLELTGVSLEVREVTPDGRPVEVRFTFDVALESPSLRWLVWDGARYGELALPAIGAPMRFPATSLAPR